MDAVSSSVCPIILDCFPALEICWTGDVNEGTLKILLTFTSVIRNEGQMGKWRQALTFYAPRRSLAENNLEQKAAMNESIEAEGTVTHWGPRDSRNILFSLPVKIFHCWNCAFCTLQNSELLSLLTTDHVCQRQDNLLIKCHAAALVSAFGIEAWGSPKVRRTTTAFKDSPANAEWSCWESRKGQRMECKSPAMRITAERGWWLTWQMLHPVKTSINYRGLGHVE